MKKKDYVLEAVAHRSSGAVPYCIMLTGDAYQLYGEQLLKDFPCKEAREDLREGKISFVQAVNLSIGNFMIQTEHPWWGWDYDNMPAAYLDPLETPTVMPAILREDTSEALEKFRNNTKYIAEKYGTYMSALIYGSHWEKAYFTRGIENFLADLAGSPEFSQQLLNFIVKTNLELLPNIIGCKEVDGVLLGSDWGTQNDLIMSPNTWRTMVKPGEKLQYTEIKGAGKQVMIHSCGCILRVMDDLVELGVDILNPVQPECMDLKLLKERYGSNISFWGGISTQRTLPYGTPKEVQEETARTIGLMSENGGYITCSSQEIQTDVPYENLKALIETARSFAIG